MRQILDSSKLKEFADDNFKFDENCRKLSKWVENTAGKGEIARYEQFLLFLQCFQKACFPGASKGVIVWEWVKHLSCYKITGSIPTHFYAPASLDWGHVVFALSVCLFVCPSVCLQKTLTLALIFEK